MTPPRFPELCGVPMCLSILVLSPDGFRFLWRPYVVRFLGASYVFRALRWPPVFRCLWSPGGPDVVWNLWGLLCFDVCAVPYDFRLLGCPLWFPIFALPLCVETPNADALLILGHRAGPIKPLGRPAAACCRDRKNRLHLRPHSARAHGAHGSARRGAEFRGRSRGGARD